eukprot:TRINITY_DN4911_c3_g1_i1.p1 TRINITY_DN4911_c3_g1~~TRINITY_DN4911_c3_g1_i1.p1  ORF type:complete len:670 (+),score=133.59 TRINITY_DN4911_c3_g1_i1:41-2050(+)
MRWRLQALAALLVLSVGGAVVAAAVCGAAAVAASVAAAAAVHLVLSGWLLFGLERECSRVLKDSEETIAAAAALSHGDLSLAGESRNRITTPSLRNALEHMVQRCRSSDDQLSSGTTSVTKSGKWLSGVGLARSVFLGDGRMNVVELEEAARRRLLVATEDEVRQREEGRRRFTTHSLNSVSPVSQPRLGGRPGSLAGAPQGWVHTASTGSAGAPASASEDSPGSLGPRRRHASMIGKLCDDSSGSDSSSDELPTRKLSSTLTTRVRLRGARPQSPRSLNQVSGVVRGARQLGAGRRSPSSSDDEGRAALEQVLLEKPANVELYHAGLQSVPLPVTTTLLGTTRYLDLSNNRIAELPEEIGDMRLLERLNVSSNELRRVPHSVPRLPNLEELHCQHNSIAELPDCFLSPLKLINLAWNSLPSFPEQLLTLPYLRTLNLSENEEIRTLPETAAFRRVDPELTIRLDNEPSLKQAVAAFDHMPCRVDWNAVFPDLVIPGLFLGPLRSAQDRVYDRLGITHVATIGRELDVRPPSYIEHLKISVDDLPDEDIRPLLQSAHDFIHRALSQSGACFVHCFKGQSRSATVVISYLMVYGKHTLNSAMMTVREVRPMVRPNEGFLLQIARLEEMLEHDARSSRPCSSTSPVSRRTSSRLSPNSSAVRGLFCTKPSA